MKPLRHPLLQGPSTTKDIMALTRGSLPQEDCSPLSSVSAITNLPLMANEGDLTDKGSLSQLYPNNIQEGPFIEIQAAISNLIENGPIHLNNPVRAPFQSIAASSSHDSKDTLQNHVPTSPNYGPAPVSLECLEIRDKARFLVNSSYTYPYWVEPFTSRAEGETDYGASEEYCNAKIQRTGERCSCKAKKSHPPGLLPMCCRHALQPLNRLLAGRCRYVDETTGEACYKLLHWVPPYFELCGQHKDWKGFPCYLLSLPSELREMIWDYLLPDKWLPFSQRTSKVIHTTSRKIWNPAGLMLNKQLYAEARNLFYRKVHFRVSLSARAFSINGKSYPLSPYKDFANALQVQRPHLGLPAYLKYVRNLRMQIIYVKPPDWALELLHQSTLWDDEVQLYDTQDAVRAFCSNMKEIWSRKSKEDLNSEFNLKSLMVYLVTQDPKNRWGNELLEEQYRVIMSPLKLLSNIGHAEFRHLHIPGVSPITLGLPQSSSGQGLAATMFIPDSIISLQEANERGPAYSAWIQRNTSGWLHEIGRPIQFDNEFFVLIDPDRYKEFSRCLTLVASPGSAKPRFNEFNNMIIETVKSPTPQEHPYSAADSAFLRFHVICSTIEGLKLIPGDFNMRRGSKDSLWHKARMARERGDVETIFQISHLLYQSASQSLDKALNTLKAKCRDMSGLSSVLSVLQFDVKSTSKHKQDIEECEAFGDSIDVSRSAKRLRLSY